MDTDFTFPDSDMRFAQTGDVTELVKLVNSAYRGDHSRLGWTTEADLLDGIRTHPEHMLEQITSPNSVMMVITGSTGGIKACVYLQEKQPLLYLGMLTVKPELQAAGIGKRLCPVPGFRWRADDGHFGQRGTDCLVCPQRVSTHGRKIAISGGRGTGCAPAAHRICSTGKEVLAMAAPKKCRYNLFFHPLIAVHQDGLFLTGIPLYFA
jgi:hypothetical protein